MNRLLRLIVSIAAVALLWSCGGSDSFRIMGVIEGLGTQNLQVVYFGDGSIKTMRSTAVDGKFSIEGSSRDYTVVDVFTSTRSLVASFVVKNGDHVECALELNNPEAKMIKGSKPSVELMRWIGDNRQAIEAGQTDAVNRSVAAFIGENGENVVSSVLLTRYFDARGREREADSLLRSITQKARMSSLTESYRDGLVFSVDSGLPALADSLWFVGADRRRIDVDPTKHKATFLYFTPQAGARIGSNDNLLKKLTEEVAEKDKGKEKDKDKDKKKKTISVLEIDDINAGIEIWKKEVENDSLPWERVWHPGVSATTALPSRPWVIVADSLGQIRYSGSDFYAGISKARELCL